MNCFVLRVDGVLCVGHVVCYLLRCLGKWAAPQGWGGHRASPMSARAASPPSPRPALRMRTSRGAELFHQPQRSPAHVASVINTLGQLSWLETKACLCKPVQHRRW